MSRKKISKVNVSKQEFKKIKKGKQTIIVRLNNEETNKIKSKDKIVIQRRIGRLRKKVKETRVYSTLETLTNNIEKKQLGYKKKDTPNYDYLIKDYSNEEIKKYGLLVIELNKKTHIFRKVLLGILIIVILFLSFSFISNKLDEIKIKEFSNNINELTKERTDYVFVEINPSFVLTIKDNKVSDVACLNDDCIEIYNDIDVKGKNINDSIDNLYNTSKEKGFDTSNGVKVKTSDNVSIETKDYITVEYIDTAKEKELLNEIKNNEEIKNVSNDDYYSKLWKELKKDSDYGEVYTCNLNDSKELECYIKEDFIVIDKDLLEMEDMVEIIANYPKVIPRLEKIERVLKKFGFNVRTVVTDLFISPAEIINVRGSDFSYVTGATAKDVYYTGKIHCSFYMFNLTDLNLLKPNNIPLIFDDEDDYPSSNSEDYYSIKKIIDEDNYIEERHSRYCNEIHCLKEFTLLECSCNLQEDGNYSWDIEETTTYQECGLGYENCKYVSGDEYRFD